MGEQENKYKISNIQMFLIDNNTFNIEYCRIYSWLPVYRNRSNISRLFMCNLIN